MTPTMTNCRSHPAPQMMATSNHRLRRPRLVNPMMNLPMRPTMNPTDQDHFESARSYQEYYDSALREVGIRIPAPVLGQTVNEYRRKTLHAMQQALLPRQHELSKVDFHELKGDALKVMEPQALDACKAERVNPNNVPLGQLKPIKVFDSYSGHLRETCFIGQESFVKHLTRPGRRVLSFAADGRIFDAAKGSWR